MDLHQTEMTIRAAAEPAIAELEQRRKDEPRAFYSRPGHSDENGEGFNAASTLASVFRGYADRLEALR
jgi:hypothetical protein